jgi:anthranilate phosphoribosyltransferase
MSTAVANPPDPKLAMRSIIQRIATGPELSKDISRDEARLGMRAILDGAVDPVQAGIFLIALRMKRETDDENLGVFEAIREVTTVVTADVDELMDVADPYDGYNRSLPPSPFLPALLAECGIPAVSHGVERIGPKYGITHHQVLRAAGVPVDLTPANAAARIADPRLGWAYVDQRQYAPRLHALTNLRSLIVKRPALTTVETLVGPIRGRRKTHTITGYVHKPYPRIYALLARHAGFDSALIVRGVEGGVIPSLRQEGKLHYYRDKGEEQTLELQPGDFGIDQPVRAVPIPEHLGKPKEGGDEIAVAFDTEPAARAAADAGLAALGGATGPTRDALTYAAAICLWHLGRFDALRPAADHVRAVLDSGRARRRFEAARA